MTEGAPLSSVEQVREELRRLGYLESGLDRFVLGGAGPTSALRACLGAAARVGLLGGLLAASALLLAAVSLDRGLLGEPRDLVVLALYLFVVLSVGVGAAAFLAGLLAAWAERRGRTPSPRLATNLGRALGLSAMTYVVFWWRSHAAEAHPLVQALALLLGLALSLVLGRFGALSAVAVLSAAGRPADLPQRSLTRRHLLPLLAAAGLTLAGTLGLASYLRERSQAPPDFAVVPSGVRVRLLGLDGLDPRLARQLVAKGELPQLARLMARSAQAPLAVEPERVPAIVWTTIATGRGPEAHGIQSAGVRRLAGMRTPVSAGEGRVFAALGAVTDLLRLTRAQPPSALLRGVKTFWNVASEKGLRVGVVNWWATWPAEPLYGYVVSDRAVFKLEQGGPSEREVAPADAFERLRMLLPASEASRAARLDRFHLAAALLLRSEAPPDLEALYLSGLDIVTMQQMDAAAVADLATLEEHLEAVRAHYRLVDELLGRLLDDLQPRELLVLVADPGRLARTASASPEGLLLIAGEGVVPGTLARATERDVAPTVLHLAGLPVSQELDGHVLEQAFTAGFRTAHPVRRVPAYGRRTPGGPRESAFDEHMLEELRSLGYIQ